MKPRVALFRPADERLEEAVSLLEDAGYEAVPDPMLSIVPTGNLPRTDADYVILTSRTGANLLADADWTSDATICAIGESTATALEIAGYAVDILPSEYTSSGLVATLAGTVAGKRVEVARSDHGSRVLLDGLNDEGAYVHETVLYGLERPADAGKTVTLAAAGELDAVLFTSSLTVEHFLAIAEEEDCVHTVREALDAAVVGVIGEPTRQTAEAAGLEVDVVAERADMQALVDAIRDHL